MDYDGLFLFNSAFLSIDSKNQSVVNIVTRLYFLFLLSFSVYYWSKLDNIPNIYHFLTI